jgi:hypothetical protein
MFGGETYDEKKDGRRLRTQLVRVWQYMYGRGWCLLADIEKAARASDSAASARVRDFRKVKFGGHTVERRRLGDGSGRHEYRLIVNRTTGSKNGPQTEMPAKPRRRRDVNNG